MSSSHTHFPLAQAGALCTEPMRARLIVTAGFYFYGYWFSQRRA